MTTAPFDGGAFADSFFDISFEINLQSDHCFCNPDADTTTTTTPPVEDCPCGEECDMTDGTVGECRTVRYVVGSTIFESSQCTCQAKDDDDDTTTITTTEDAQDGSTSSSTPTNPDDCDCGASCTTANGGGGTCMRDYDASGNPTSDDCTCKPCDCGDRCRLQDNTWGHCRHEYVGCCY